MPMHFKVQNSKYSSFSPSDTFSQPKLFSKSFWLYVLITWREFTSQCRRHDKQSQCQANVGIFSSSNKPYQSQAESRIRCRTDQYTTLRSTLINDILECQRMISPKTNRILWPTCRSNAQIPSATSRVFSTNLPRLKLYHDDEWHVASPLPKGCSHRVSNFHRWCVTKWCGTKLCAKDGVWQSCVWKRVCDKVSEKLCKRLIQQVAKENDQSEITPTKRTSKSSKKHVTEFAEHTQHDIFRKPC